MRASKSERERFLTPSFSSNSECFCASLPIRTALERRYRLLPYFYTLFREFSVTGMPVMQPIFMADPKKTALPQETYPIVSLIDGDLKDPAQATLRIRPGAIVPLGKVIQNTTEESLDPLTLLVCLNSAGEAEGQLYEDDGEGFGYRSGKFRLTTFKAKEEGGSGGLHRGEPGKASLGKKIRSSAGREAQRHARFLQSGALSRI
jgi:alpha-glucosidase